MTSSPSDADRQARPVLALGRGAQLHVLAEPALQGAVYALHAREPHADQGILDDLDHRCVAMVLKDRGGGLRFLGRTPLPARARGCGLCR